MSANLRLVVAEATKFARRSQLGLDELAEATNLTEEEISHALAADYAVMSLDGPVSADDDAVALGEELDLSRETVRLMQQQALEVLKRGIQRLMGAHAIFVPG